MKYNIFISYPNSESDIVENFASHLRSYGVNAWVYSLDRTFTKDIWDEIEVKIKESDLIIFVVSEDTVSASGQHRELNLAFDKVKSSAHTNQIMPIFISGTNPLVAPEGLRNKNGDFLDATNVKSLALKIAKTVFPSLIDNHFKKPWTYPIPGEWLEICNLDKLIELYFNIGDKLYFRSISPMGLFECYAPKIKNLFWIAHYNVKPSYDNAANKELEIFIPKTYSVTEMLEIYQLGWDAKQAIEK